MHNLDWREVFKYELNAPNEIQPNQQALPNSPHEIRHTTFPKFPYVYLSLPTKEIASKIMERALLIDVLIEVLSEGKTYDELIQKTDL
jgi:hypothetical protein